MNNKLSALLIKLESMSTAQGYDDLSSVNVLSKSDSRSLIGGRGNNGCSNTSCKGTSDYQCSNTECSG